MAAALSTSPWTLQHAVAAGARQPLIQFWLAAPEDVLENLWHSQVGEITRQLVAQLTTTTYLQPELVQLRDELAQQLRQGLGQPGAVKLLIATFLVSPPGAMRIANPEANLPGWLVPGYRALYEQGQMVPATAPQPSQADNARPSAPTPQPSPNFGPFPSSLAEFAANRIQLNRLLGLSNLYYIDPEDQEILQELRQIRQQLTALILQHPEAELEALFSQDLGDRYWALVRSGVQKEPLQPAEEQLKAAVTRKLQPNEGGGFGTAGAINAFLVAMAFYEPGSMQVADAQHKLPAWLHGPYQEAFAKAIASA